MRTSVRTWKCIRKRIGLLIRIVLSSVARCTTHITTTNAVEQLILWPKYTHTHQKYPILSNSVCHLLCCTVSTISTIRTINTVSAGKVEPLSLNVCMFILVIYRLATYNITGHYTIHSSWRFLREVLFFILFVLRSRWFAPTIGRTSVPQSLWPTVKLPELTNHCAQYKQQWCQPTERKTKKPFKHARLLPKVTLSFWPSPFVALGMNGRHANARATSIYYSIGASKLFMALWWLPACIVAVVAWLW